MLIKNALDWLNDRIGGHGKLAAFFAGGVMGMIDFFMVWGTITWVFVVIRGLLNKNESEE